MKIKVSVIIPVYNTEDYLKECIESLVNQTLREIEILIVNDGSTDSSLKILEKYAVKVGGGHNHRFNLSDGVMLKDNHIAAAGGILNEIGRASCRERV